MKTTPLVVVLVSLISFQVLLCNVPFFGTQAAGYPDVFVGVQVGYGDVAEAKARIDQVSTYTNLVVIGSYAIAGNLTKLNETSQYAYDKGLSIISLCPSLGRANRTGWLEYAEQTWGNRLLGFYAYDEPAGRQLDLNESRIGNTMPSSWADAAYLFESNMSSQLNYAKRYLTSTPYQLFTSDYALYWFDYKSGYDTIFAEFGWNYSRSLNVALVRGAASVQNKEWGLIITWTYTHPPYIEAGPQLLDDMKFAYNNGAKYIIIFDTNADYTKGTLQQEHLQALQQFWQYVQANPRPSNPVAARTAYVLPDSFGYGFRGPNDRIWGLWEANAFSFNISVCVGCLLQEYGSKLDIIYSDGLQPVNNCGYKQLIYWNSYSPPTSPLPSSSPSPLLALAKTPTTTSIESPFSFTDYFPLIIAGTVVTSVVVPMFLLRKRQYCVTFLQNGVGRDCRGAVVVVDGESYDRNGTLFWWDSGSRHTFDFESPITVGGSKQYVKQYVWASTTGLTTHQHGILTASMSSTVTGNYRHVFKIGASLPTVTNHRLRSSAKDA